jgi:serine-type D-Ala-D-Ala carboxypeptidase/endopeptidase (penicillin-binding protein 4)
MLMTVRSRALVSLALSSLLTFSSSIEAQTKKTAKRPATRKAAARTPAKPPARVAEPQASGATLEQRLSSLLNSSVATTATTSVQIVDVETGRVVAQRNPNMPVAPASNMKLFTTAAAMELLSDDFEFTTPVSIRGNVDATGMLAGDVKITGGGDPTIGGRFHDGNATAVIQNWASALKQQGVRTVAGDLVIEYGYFDTEYIHPTWPTDQLVNWYEAPIASLSMQEGCVLVRVLPSRPGERAIVQMEPPNNFLTVENSCVTGGGRGVFVTRMPNSNRIIVRGNVPARSGATEIFVTVMNPVHYFANVANMVLQQNGIEIQGSVKLVAHDPRNDWRSIAAHKTPLSVVNIVINKKSQNHYAEQVLKTIGAEVRKDGSWRGGSQAVTEWLVSKVGVQPNEYTQIDGSGMSRFNRASAAAFTSLLRYMWTRPYRHEFLSSMPYSGERDSRLRRRLNQEPFARNVYAKTGYISGVVGLSGYVRAESGKVYAFSFLFNRYRTGVFGVYNLQDQMLKEIVSRG